MFLRIDSAVGPIIRGDHEAGVKAVAHCARWDTRKYMQDRSDVRGSVRRRGRAVWHRCKPKWRFSRMPPSPRSERALVGDGA